MLRLRFAALAGALLLTASPVAMAQTDDQTDWSGLRTIETKMFDQAQLLPGTDFAAYTRVMIDPTEVAFRKNWQKDWNDKHFDFDERITDDDARRILSAVQTGFQDIFTKAYLDAGYQVVSTPGQDVLRLKTYILNLDIAAPDFQKSNVRTLSKEGGGGVLVLEARDSMSGALLAQAADRRDIGDTALAMRRTKETNRADFEGAFKAWAKISVEGLARLKALPPVPATESKAARTGK
ncbi:MAG TPA: DUF3313 family protein [Hyphomonadaceae bacterium]|nr:DUF3313 family protein [Hyphomonadaceae bacterium]